MSSDSDKSKRGPPRIIRILKPIILLAVGSSAAILSFEHPTAFNFLQFEKPEEWNLEAKMKIFITSLQLSATIIFCNIVLTILGRMLLNNPEPILGKDSLYVSMVNRTLANTIEVSFVFYPIFLYWLLNKATVEDYQKAYIACYLYPIARVIYTLGYLTGLFIKVSHRAAGVGASLGLVFALILKSI